MFPLKEKNVLPILSLLSIGNPSKPYTSNLATLALPQAILAPLPRWFKDDSKDIKMEHNVMKAG